MVGYALRGGKLLSHTSTDATIARTGLVEVRASTECGGLDSFVRRTSVGAYTVIEPIGLIAQTIIVEGNRNGPGCEGTAKLGNEASTESVR